MIRTAMQLKALVRNMSKGNSAKAQIIIRNYVMERFLERLSLSRYKNNIILKGGVLVAAMVGLDNRSTMDVDTTLKNLPLNVECELERCYEIRKRFSIGCKVNSLAVEYPTHILRSLTA